MKGYADDLASVVVGHAVGGGEIIRYTTRRGRVAKLVLIAASVPLMLRSAGNPDGLAMQTFWRFSAAEYARSCIDAAVEDL